jgi:Uma2 family endonuclease
MTFVYLYCMEQFVLTFPTQVQFTDDELFEFCSANSDLVIERDKNGNLLIMSPSGGLSGNFHMKIYRYLLQWHAEHEELGYTFDSSTGFRLPDGSMRAPDAAFVAATKWNSLTKDQQEKFPPVCPDFILEVRSQTDSTAQLKGKMKEWIDNGCQLGWLIDPIEKRAYVYQLHTEPTEYSFNQSLSGGHVLPGFILNLNVLR